MNEPGRDGKGAPKSSTNEESSSENSSSDKTAVGEQVDWAQQLFTPADAIVLKPTPSTPSQPKKRRRLQVDRNTTLTGVEIRDNLGNPEKLVGIPISAGTLLPSAKDLFDKPILFDMVRNPGLQKWWDNNCTLDGASKNKKKRLPIDRPTSSEEEQIMLLPHDSPEVVVAPPKSPELQRDPDETPSSIDVPRAGNASLRSLERSSGSTLLINQTPGDDALSSRSLDVMLEVDELLGDIPVRDSPRMSGIGILPDIMEADLNDSRGPILDPIAEGPHDETLINERSTIQFDVIRNEDELEQSFFTIEKDDEHLPKHLARYKQRITASIGEADSLKKSVSFFDLFPHNSTKRRDALSAFYTCLNLTKNGIIDVGQEKMFGDIRIWKKE